MMPAKTSPVAPSIEMSSPSRKTKSESTTWKRCSASLTRIPSQPATQGRPSPRATTAAWLVAPPRAVKTPLATSMPCTSSGLVSGRTRRGIQSLSRQASLILSLLLFILVKARQQQLIDLGGVGALDGLLFLDQAFIDHVYENFDGG